MQAAFLHCNTFHLSVRLLHACANPVGRLRVQEVHAGLPSHVTQDVDNRSAAAVAGMASHALDFLDALRLDSRDVLGYVDDK
jgi:hypothetical protein